MEQISTTPSLPEPTHRCRHHAPPLLSCSYRGKSKLLDCGGDGGGSIAEVVVLDQATTLGVSKSFFARLL